MDVGTTNGWRLDDVVSAAEVLEPCCAREFELEPVEPAIEARWRRASATPRRRRARLRHLRDARHSAATARALRLSADGQLYTCLFAARGHDLKAVLRGGATDDEIEAAPARDLDDPRRSLLANPRGRHRLDGPRGDVLHRRVKPTVPRGVHPPFPDPAPSPLALVILAVCQRRRWSGTWPGGSDRTGPYRVTDDRTGPYRVRTDSELFGDADSWTVPSQDRFRTFR